MSFLLMIPNHFQKQTRSFFIFQVLAGHVGIFCCSFFLGGSGKEDLVVGWSIRKEEVRLWFVFLFFVF